MATFYGVLEGNRGSVSRTGSKSSGMRASLQSFDGSIINQLYYNKEGKLSIRIDFAKDSSSYYGDMVFSGTVEDFIKKLQC